MQIPMSMSKPFKDAHLLPTLALAYIGDAVFELYVRIGLVNESVGSMKSLHRAAVDKVCAKSQSELAERLLPTLTPDELSIYKRGRNTKSSVPKNADMRQYRNATGLEALVGYLYLSGNSARLLELLSGSNITETEQQR